MEHLFGGNKAKKAAKADGATKKESKSSAKGARKKNTGKILKGSEDVLRKTGEAVIWAPLLIFKPMMKKRLDKINVVHTNKMDDISTKFYNNVVTKSSFENFVVIDGYNAVGDAVAISAGVAELKASGDPSSLIQAIINWITNLAKKKKLSPEDAESKKDAEEAAKTASDAAKKGKGNFFDALLRLLGLKKKLPTT